MGVKKTSRKTPDYRNYTIQAMQEAIDTIKGNHMSLRKAALMFKVPRSTLSERVTGIRPVETTWGKRKQVSSEDESRLVEHIKGHQKGLD